MRILNAFFAAALSGVSAAAAADPGAAAKAINEFGADLHQRLVRKSGENLCISPYSIQTALGMTFAGADGDTRDEMGKVLHFGKGDSIHASFAALQAALEKARALSAKSKEPMALHVANRLFGQKGFEFRAPFRELLKETYGAPLEEMDFSASAKAAKHINGWVENQTRNRIRDLIPPDALSALTRLVLVNAVYMKASWEMPFAKEATKPAPFHIAGGAPIPVPTMVRKGQFGYAKRAGHTAVTMPYTGGEVQFLILLPDKPGGLPALEKTLSGKLLSDSAQLESADVLLHLPKVKMEPPTISLKGALLEMGMKSAFDVPGGSTNFDRMAPRDQGNPLYISEALHKTFLEVDEKGTEAAAATAVLVTETSARREPDPIVVKVDRPFLFAIQHRPTAACLFLGRVADPR